VAPESVLLPSQTLQRTSGSANFVNSIKGIRSKKNPEEQPGFGILLEFKAED
jgi:hypothetical protein